MTYRSFNMVHTMLSQAIKKQSKYGHSPSIPLNNFIVMQVCKCQDPISGYIWFLVQGNCITPSFPTALFRKSVYVIVITWGAQKYVSTWCSSYIFWLWSSILKDKRKPMLSKIIFGMLIFVAKYLNKSIPLLLAEPENQMG